MKIKYYTRHFSFMLPIFIVSFLGACSKLDSSYSAHKADMKIDMGVDIEPKVDKRYYSDSVTFYRKPPLPWTQKLFEAIRKIDTSTVLCLLETLDVDPEDDWVHKIRPSANRIKRMQLQLI